MKSLLIFIRIHVEGTFSARRKVPIFERLKDYEILYQAFLEEFKKKKKSPSYSSENKNVLLRDTCIRIICAFCLFRPCILYGNQQSYPI